MSTVNSQSFEELTKDSGVRKQVLAQGVGDPPRYNNIVTVHYTAYLDSVEERQLESTWTNGVPFKFKLGLGMVIKGWDIGVATMKVGEKSVLFVRSDYAYGADGSPPNIPSKANLKFEIELLKIEKEPETLDELVAECNKLREDGNKLYNDKHFVEAFRTYEKALNLFRFCFPDEDEEKRKMNNAKIPCLLNQCVCKIQLQEFSEGKNYCGKVLEIDPHNSKALMRRGQCLAGLGEFDAARRDYHAALKLDPNNPHIPKLLDELKKKETIYKEKSKRVVTKMIKAFGNDDNEHEGSNKK
jgi:peptidylprolyl isomerase